MPDQRALPLAGGAVVEVPDGFLSEARSFSGQDAGLSSRREGFDSPPRYQGVRFFVPGVPQPGGSKRGFPVKLKSGKQRIAIVEDAKHNAAWRAVVSLAARQHVDRPFAGPVVVFFDFVMPRPKHHFGTGRNAARLRPGAPLAHTIKPDRTKLQRSTEDALTGIVWGDDCQVVAGGTSKLYGDVPGCWITILEFKEKP